MISRQNWPCQILLLIQSAQKKLIMAIWDRPVEPGIEPNFAQIENQFYRQTRRIPSCASRQIDAVMRTQVKFVQLHIISAEVLDRKALLCISPQLLGFFWPDFVLFVRLCKNLGVRKYLAHKSPRAACQTNSDHWLNRKFLE